MVNSPAATETEGHQRNNIRTPTLTTSSGRNLLLTVRTGAVPSTRSSPP